MSTQTIQKVPLFASLPIEEIESLEKTLQEISSPSGTTLFQEGDYGDSFYIVLAGEVSIIKALGTPNERLVAVRGGSEFVGEMSLLSSDGLRTASAKVSQDATLLKLTHAQVDALLYRYPPMAYEMLRVLSSRLRISHDVAIKDLQEKNERLLQAYEELKTAQAQLIEKEALERELQRAREIQMSMLPATLPQMKGLQIGARVEPARMVGGDFYDVIALDENRVGVVVGDVSGKGVPAALFMALTRSLLRAEAVRDASPEAVLRTVNRHLLGMNARKMFVTVLYGVVDSTTREFVYARAGHDLPFIWNKQHIAQVLPSTKGQPLALFRHPALDVQTVPLSAGDTLLLYTDGITEAANERGEFFEVAGLETAVLRSPFSTAQTVCDDLVNIVTEFHGNTPQADDITLVAIHVN